MNKSLVVEKPEFKCPFAELNEDYPYEGMVTKHKCMIKPALKKQCNNEMSGGCVLFECMKTDIKLRNFCLEWSELKRWNK